MTPRMVWFHAPRLLRASGFETPDSYDDACRREGSP